ncbi:MATE family Na+-driven efflux transporter [Maribacter ulvicola]|uniref:Na+-driven multidrug efflux pump n=1 Tax=Maribacter ulvicola TaxID=228959 RepID=A0A1N7ATZ4_9FLAO|nr:MATE family Na+-driven efflux transporter [Maribacter ulvicola]SIR42589.1 Na+-driven multidrug efflux pump [Maribacter ulvicola]
MITTLKKSLIEFNTKLYLVLILMLLIPTIYKTLRIYYLGDLPNDSGFNIASQIIWLNVIFEVIQEAILLPLFFLLGKSINDNLQTENKIKTGLITTGIIYLSLLIIIYFFADSLLLLMKQKESLIKLSSHYIKLESIAIFLSVVYRFTLIVLILLGKVKRIFLLLITQTIIIIICDSLLLSQYSFSMQLGVLGIAYGNIIVELILIIISLFVLKKENVFWFKNTPLDFSWLKNWFKIGSLSGLESLIRNTVFIIMIIRLINSIEGQSFFWVSNSFIWSWLLIPIIALGDLIKKEISEKKIALNKVINFSIIITTSIVLIWLSTIPLWNSFFKNFMNISNPEIVLNITITAIIYYISFAYNNIIDSVFYGYGRTDLMLIQSILINIIYYGIVFFTFKLTELQITLNIIVTIFGLGILFDSIITFGIYKYSLNRNSLTK